jgi:hypothetical protein
MPRNPKTSNAKRAVALVRRIDRWLERTGVTSSKARSHIAVDLGDALAAMDQIRRLTSQMLRSDPATKRGADRALTHAAELGELASTELLWHLRGLNRRWETHVEQPLARRSEGKLVKHAAV